MKAVLVGNYGVGNFGDEALREYFLRAFPDVEWTVVSARPGSGELPRLSMGPRSLVTTRWWRTIGAIKRADVVVFGGGTLFTDVEMVRACFLWGVHALAAKLAGTPYVLAFQGVGPFETIIGEAIARWVARRAAHVSVRDHASMERVTAWDMAPVPTFDPVYLAFLRAARERRPDGTTVVVPRHTSTDAFLSALAGQAMDASKTVIATFQPDDAGERRTIEGLRRRYPAATVRVVSTIDGLMELLAGASLCVCERFHGALAAAAAGVPLVIVPQSAGDKLDELRRRLTADGLAEAAAQAEAGESALRDALRSLR